MSNVEKYKLAGLTPKEFADAALIIIDGEVIKDRYGDYTGAPEGRIIVRNTRFPHEVEEMLGKVWDAWGAMSDRQRRRVYRRYPQLGRALDLIKTQVDVDLRQAWKTIRLLYQNAW